MPSKVDIGGARLGSDGSFRELPWSRNDSPERGRVPALPRSTRPTKLDPDRRGALAPQPKEMT
jgi:hypothetical protein